MALDQIREVAPSLSRAFHYYCEAGDVSRAVAIVQIPHSEPLIGGLRGVISRAAQLVTQDSIEAGRILANHGLWACLLTIAKLRVIRSRLNYVL